MGKEWDAFVATYFMERVFKSIKAGHLLSLQAQEHMIGIVMGFKVSRV